jgi:hypothetical protein
MVGRDRQVSLSLPCLFLLGLSIYGNRTPTESTISGLEGPSEVTQFNFLFYLNFGSSAGV